MTRAVDEGTGFSISGTELTASSYRKKLTLILSHPLYPQINFWWVVDLNIKSKTIKLLEGIVFATLGYYDTLCPHAPYPKPFNRYIEYQALLLFLLIFFLGRVMI